MEEWKTYKLGDVCDTISETYKANASDVVLVNTSDVLNGKCLNHKQQVNKDLKGQFKKTFQKDDILYSEIRPANRRFAYIDFVPNNYIASTKLMVLRHNQKILPKYLYYILQSKDVIAELQMLAESRSGTFPQITFSELANLNIVLPPLPIQQQILNILIALDDKIELNRRINDNLEQQAQALFKSWFVDFEPFQQGKFVESELGLIPEGWRVGTFSEIIDHSISGDWGKESLHANYTQQVYCIRGADIPNIKVGDKGSMPTRFILAKNYQSKALAANDLVVEISGGSPTQSTGRICRISKELLRKYESTIICTNFCKALKPTADYSVFLYNYWELLYKQGVMFSYENGTTGIKNLDINGLVQKELVIIPPQEIARIFNQQISMLYDKIQFNGVESEKLSSMRDNLLPKLMSGELKINEINC